MVSDRSQPFPLATSTIRTAAHVFANVAVSAAAGTATRQGDDRLTYAELSLAAGAVAEWLRGHGVGRGDVVATVMDRTHRCMAGVLGAWAVGAAYLHIETTDPDARVSLLLGTPGVRAVLTDDLNRRRLPSTVPRLVLDDAGPGLPYPQPPAEADPADTAYLVCTSGSTGTPKAVDVPHRALLNYCAAFWSRMGTTTLDSFGLATTFAADLGKVSVYGALLSGARLDVYPRETVLDPRRMAADLAAHPVDCLTYTPSQLDVLARHGDLAALLPGRALVVAGEPFPPRLAAAVLSIRPDLEVYNGYGPSEATVLATMHRVRPDDVRRARVPIGDALPGVRSLVLDERLQPVPDGTPGILYLGGLCLANGYRGQPALTSAAFVTSSGPDGAQVIYRTDDVVIREPGGTLDCLGRVDRQLKIRGNRVEPGEVECALLALPGIDQAIVTGERSDPTAPLELVAYVVGRVEIEDVFRLLDHVLPSALVPSRIEVVPEIPVTSNGKADLSALRAAAAATTRMPPVAADLPRGDTEQFVAAVWSDVLGRRSVGRHERFMEIGGNSFKALAVFARLRRRHTDIGIADLYAHATVAELASLLDGRGSEPTGPGPVQHAAADIVEI